MHVPCVCLLLYLLAPLLAQVPEEKSSTRVQRFKQDLEECRAINPVTDETLESLHRRGVLLDQNDQDARCFVVCMMQKGELVDSTGDFSSPRAKQYIVRRAPVLYERGPLGGSSDRGGAVAGRGPSQQEVDAAVDQCAEQSGSGKCMTNYKIWTCLYTQLHQL